MLHFQIAIPFHPNHIYSLHHCSILQLATTFLDHTMTCGIFWRCSFIFCVACHLPLGSLQSWCCELIFQIRLAWALRMGFTHHTIWFVYEESDLMSWRSNDTVKSLDDWICECNRNWKRSRTYMIVFSWGIPLLFPSRGKISPPRGPHLVACQSWWTMYGKVSFWLRFWG